MGGQQSRSQFDEEEDNSSYETNMEKIMARFANFSQLSSDNTDDNEDEPKEEIHQEEEENTQDDEFARDEKQESPSR